MHHLHTEVHFDLCVVKKARFLISKSTMFLKIK